MVAGERMPVTLMAGESEPVSSKVTVSPDWKLKRFVPLTQFELVVSQLFREPSPTHVRSCGGGTDEMAIPTLLVMMVVPSLTVKTNAAMPVKLLLGVNVAVEPLSDTTPLLRMVAV